MSEKTDKQKAIFAAIAKLKDRLADDQALIDFLHQDIWQLTEELKATIERAEKAEQERERANLLAQDLIGQLQSRLSKTKEELAEQKERAKAGRLHAMETKNRLTTLLKAHQRFHEKVGCPGKGACYVCDLEVVQESSKEKGKETVHHPGDGTLIIRKTQQ